MNVYLMIHRKLAFSSPPYIYIFLNKRQTKKKFEYNKYDSERIIKKKF